MEKVKIDIRFVGSHKTLPVYSTSGSVAVDLIADIPGESLALIPGEIVLVKTGIAVAIPDGYAGQVLPRSGQARNHLEVPNSPGLVDPDYRGEVGVLLENTSDEMKYIQRYERIAQFMFTVVRQADFNIVEVLDETERGEGGFGHTGRV